MALETTACDHNPKVGSFAYFCDELCRFREMMGRKSDMLNPGKMLDAWKGLVYVAIHTNEKDAEIGRALDTTMLEFNMRSNLVLTKTLQLTTLDSANDTQ